MPFVHELYSVGITNYHIHDYGDFKPHNKVLDESKQHTRRIFIDQRSGAHGPGAPAEQT